MVTITPLPGLLVIYSSDRLYHRCFKEKGRRALIIDIINNNLPIGLFFCFVFIHLSIYSLFIKL